MIGPAALLDRTKVLRQITRDVIDGRRDVKRLEKGLGATRKGTGQLRDGLAAGATGAAQLADGLGQAAQGSQQLAGATNAAAPEIKSLVSGAKRAQDGSKQITGGLTQARDGTKKLKPNVDVLRDSLVAADSSSEKNLTTPMANTQSAVQSALRALGGITDPAVAADPGVQKAKQDLAKALAALGPLKTNVTNLTTELDANAAASKEIARGVDQLVDALEQLTDGSGQLDSGLDGGRVPGRVGRGRRRPAERRDRGAERGPVDTADRP